MSVRPGSGFLPGRGLRAASETFVQVTFTGRVRSMELFSRGNCLPVEASKAPVLLLKGEVWGEVIKQV